MSDCSRSIGRLQRTRTGERREEEEGENVLGLAREARLADLWVLSRRRCWRPRGVRWTWVGELEEGSSLSGSAAPRSRLNRPTGLRQQLLRVRRLAFSLAYFFCVSVRTQYAPPLPHLLSLAALDHHAGRRAGGRTASNGHHPMTGPVAARVARHLGRGQMVTSWACGVDWINAVEASGFRTGVVFRRRSEVTNRHSGYGSV